jgi:hypothetical protein
MVASGKENQEGTFPAIWSINPLCYIGKLGTFWENMGRIGSVLGQKSALPKLLKSMVVIYVYSVFIA